MKATVLFLVVSLAPSAALCSTEPGSLVLWACTAAQQVPLALDIKKGLPVHEGYRVSTVGETQIKVDIRKAKESASGNLRMLAQIAAHSPIPVILCKVKVGQAFTTLVGVRHNDVVAAVPIERIIGMSATLEAPIVGITLAPLNESLVHGAYYGRQKAWEVYVLSDQTCVEVVKTIYHELQHVNKRMGHPQIDQYTNAAERESEVYAARNSDCAR